MHTELYCTTLDQLDRVKAVRAMHQAILQLAMTSRSAEDESFDNTPAIAALGECLMQAGHVGYGGGTPVPAQPMRHFVTRQHALEYVMPELITTLQDDLDRMEGEERHHYTDEDRDEMRNRIADLQTIRFDVTLRK